MPLGKGHGATVKPAVDDFKNSRHGATAFSASQMDFIHIRPVKLNPSGEVFFGSGLQLFDAADAIRIAAFATPNWDGRSPISIS